MTHVLGNHVVDGDARGVLVLGAAPGFMNFQLLTRADEQSWKVSSESEHYLRVQPCLQNRKNSLGEYYVRFLNPARGAKGS